MNMKRLAWLMIAAGLPAVVMGQGGPGGGGRKGGGGQPPAQAVAVTMATAIQKAVPEEIRTFGTVQASSTVAVRSQITGILSAVNFQEGANVKEGDLLFTIDPRLWDVATKQFEAVLAKDRAQLENARKEAARQDELLKKGFTAEDARDQARTAAEVLAATVQADEAVVENAKLQLEYCTIRSPIDGRTGALLLHQGNVVKANDVVLTTVNRVTPIDVSFSVPQQELPRVRQAAAGKLAVRAFVPGQEDQTETGELTFIVNTVDPTTGTIGLKARFTNAAHRLWPGQFVDVVLTLALQADALVVPEQAVQASQQGSFVFVVKADMTVENRPVTVSRTLGVESVVAKGLQAGERVVTDGQLRLVPGSRVESKPEAEKR